MTLRLLVATSDDDVDGIKKSIPTNEPLYFAAPQDSQSAKRPAKLIGERAPD
jgi:hypothetical protein